MTNQEIDETVFKIAQILFPGLSPLNYNCSDIIKEVEMIKKDSQAYQELRHLKLRAQPVLDDCKESKLTEKHDPITEDLSPFSAKLENVVNGLYTMLMDKNKAYGDSALNPIGIFAQGNPEDLIRVRIDDKITRIKNLKGKDTEDPEMDLTGYLILLLISRGWIYNK